MSFGFIISFLVGVSIYIVIVLIIGFIKKRKKNRIKMTPDEIEEENKNKD